MNDYHEGGCFCLIAEVVAHCFRPPRTLDNLKTFKQLNIEFADSNVLKAWCDCAHNFEYIKLRKLIIAFNTKNYEELEKFKKELCQKASIKDQKI